jgi:hypothetical protein
MSVEINPTTETIIFWFASSSDLNKLPHGIKTIIILLFDDDESLNLPLTVERIYFGYNEKYNTSDISRLKIPFGCEVFKFDYTRERLNCRGQWSGILKYEFSLVVEHGLDVELFRTNTQILTCLKMGTDNKYGEAEQLRLKKTNDKINFKLYSI